MQHYIDFIDRYAIDPQIYIVAPHQNARQRFELYWEREKGPQRWRLRLIGEQDWTRLSSSTLRSVLEQRGADIPRVEAQVRAIALTQVVFAETLAAEARRLFGARCVEQAVEDHHAFLNEIQAVVGHFARGRLKALAGGGESSGNRAGHLFLVAEK